LRLLLGFTGLGNSRNSVLKVTNTDEEIKGYQQNVRIIQKETAFHKWHSAIDQWEDMTCNNQETMEIQRPSSDS
jgi:hypothetical protein